MPELLPVASTDAASSDFTIPAGGRAILSLKAGTSGSVPSNAKVYIERKDAASVYTVVGRMDNLVPAVTVENPGSEVMTCRANRLNSGPVGVDRA